MPANDIKRWMATLFERLAANRQRQLVVLRGPQSWCDEQLEGLMPQHRDAILFSSRHSGERCCAPAAAESWLGREARLVVIDLFRGVDPDLLSIGGGLVTAGGVLLLLAPREADWVAADDDFAVWQADVRSRKPLFYRYLMSAVDADPATGLCLDADAAIPDIGALPELTPTPIVAGQTDEQRQVLQELATWWRQEDSGIALIEADRGRGKSVCLGLLATVDASRRCLLTAPSRASAAAALAMAPQTEFVAPDRLLLESPEADLLLIDEAAMIPQSLLHQICQRYRRIVMATTSGGYEGTGQGFRLRFLSRLDPANLRRLQLRDPVRWCREDRLEAWLDSTLMLSQPQIEAETSPQIGTIEYGWLEQRDTAQAGSELRQAYALLASAHYRTRPSDLRQLMENPDVSLLLARDGGTLVAVALVNHEGGLDKDLCRDVFLGRRRPRGHLLAQMLTAQAGVEGFAGYRGLRIQRIAVSAAYRRNGIGRRLIELIGERARENGCDYTGASFALDTDTASFWRATGFELVHVSYAAGKSSGSHSIAVIQALTEVLQSDLDRLRQRLQRQLPVWLTQFLRFVDAQQVVTILRYLDWQTPLTSLEQSDIEAFTRGNRGFELCFASLQAHVMNRCARTQGPVDDWLIEKTVQNRDWRQLRPAAGVDGRKAMQKRLRELVAALGKDC